MKKLLPTRHFFERVKSQMTFRAQPSELSDWSLKISVSFAESPVSTQLSRSGWPDDPVRPLTAGQRNRRWGVGADTDRHMTGSV